MVKSVARLRYRNEMVDKQRNPDGDKNGDAMEDGNQERERPGSGVGDVTCESVNCCRYT